MRTLRKSIFSLKTVREKKIFQEKKIKSRKRNLKSDSCCYMPSSKCHQNPKIASPSLCSKVQTGTLKVHHIEHYLQLLHFPDKVFQQQLLLRRHERGHLQTTDPCVVTSIICHSLSGNTPGIAQLNQQSTVNYHTCHITGVKSHYHC